MILELNRIEYPFVFEVENENGVKTLIDASEAIGGKNKGLRPMELLASALASCAAIDILRILEKKHITTEHFSIIIEGKRSSNLPSVFEWVHLSIKLDPAIDLEQVKKVVDLTLTKYCSVAASLNANIKINYSINQNAQ